jgi:hypothetical protein
MAVFPMIPAVTVSVPFSFAVPFSFPLPVSGLCRVTITAWGRNCAAWCWRRHCIAGASC